jgi:hypothetical protein
MPPNLTQQNVIVFGSWNLNNMVIVIDVRTHKRNILLDNN